MANIMKLLTDPVTTVASFDSKGNGGIKGEGCCFDNYCYIATHEASNSSMLLTTYCYNSCRTMFDHIYFLWRDGFSAWRTESRLILVQTAMRESIALLLAKLVYTRYKNSNKFGSHSFARALRRLKL